MTGCFVIPEKLLLRLRLMVCVGLVSSGFRTNGCYWLILINFSQMMVPRLEFGFFFRFHPCTIKMLYSNAEKDAFFEFNSTLIFLAIDK